MIQNGEGTSWVTISVKSRSRITKLLSRNDVPRCGPLSKMSPWWPANKGSTTVVGQTWGRGTQASSKLKFQHGQVAPESGTK